jgi:type II secretory pathway pseudopilin PulG
MNLRGQHGYAMAALLISLSIMALLMTAVMPVWKQMSQREKEAELVFRGQQYVHAIGLFQRKSGPGVYPPSFDVLVEQRFLRRKYKDPITNADFVPVSALLPQGAPNPGSQGAATGSAAGAATGSSGGRGGTPAATTAQPFSIGANGAVPGGIAGVASKSTDTSIRIYNGQTHYNEWVFRFIAATPTPGATGGPGQRGGPPNQAPGPGGVGGPGRGERGGPGGTNGSGRGRGGPITLPDGRVISPSPDGRGFSLPQPPPGR